MLCKLLLNNMNKKITIILTYLLIASCKHSEIKPATQPPKTKSVVNSNSSVESGLFLGLDYRLTQNEFDSKLDSLEKSGRLNNGKFTIKLNETDVSFTIVKTKKSILLYSEVTKEKELQSVDARDFTRLEYENFREIVEEFRDFFENKYKDYSTELLDLSKYGFKQKYNHIYLTPSKAIIIGYTLIPNHYDIPSTDSHKKKFGYILEINYFHNSDFENIYKSAMEAKTSKNYRIDNIPEEKNRIESKKKENIKSL